MEEATEKAPKGQKKTSSNFDDTESLKGRAGTKSMQKQHQHMKSQDHPATSTQIH